MNKLLPTKEQMKPITNEHDAFFDGPFKSEFDDLTVKEKLQIINDIVRQTMIYSDCPNPLEEKESLVGDSYTACIVSEEYIRSLKLNLEIQKVFAYINPCENENNAIPIPVLQIKNGNEVYLYDATPKIGYKAGMVEKLSNQYQCYINMDDEVEEVYELLRTIKYLVANNLYSKIKLKKIIDFCTYAQKFPILTTIISEIGEMLKERNITTKIFKNDSNYDKNIIVGRINCWKDELLELQKKDSNYQRQIELAQLITFYSNILNNETGIYLMLDDGRYEISKLTPRILYEKGFEYITIKPSAYIINEEENVEIAFSGVIYGVNYKEFGRKTSLGLEPMKLFHPEGYKYIREMTGPTKNFLIKKTIEETLETKRRIRKQIRENIMIDDIIWFDGMPIKWNPACLNFVHSSDNSVDACMGYTATTPEYQIMTRFNYPNPVLMKEKKYE